MKNLKKLLAVVVAVTVLLTAMVPAMAATAPEYGTEAEVLHSLNLFSGTSSSSFVPALENDLKREDGTILVLAALGKADEAKAMAAADVTAELAKYTDAADVAPYAKNFVAYATKIGAMNGVGGGKFGAKTLMSGKQVATAVLAAIGYTTPADFTFDTSVTKLGEFAKVELDATLANNSKRDAAVAIFYTVLSANAKGKTTTVLADLVASGDVTKEAAVASGLYVDPVAAKLAVKSVVPANLKEVVVTFNKAVAKAELEKVGNYTVGGVSATGAAVSADLTSVTLTLDPSKVDANNVSYEVVVKKAVGLEADYKATVKFVDTTIPSITGVTLTGPKTIDVAFNEPIEVVPTTVKIKDGIYGIALKSGAGTNKLTYELSASSLPEGDYKFEVKGYKDYAGLPGDDYTTTVKYVKDTTALTASIKKASQTEVVVEFNKAIEMTASSNAKYFYHTFSAWVPSSAAISSDAKSVTLDFSNHYIPEGTANLVIKYNAGETDKELKDLWGNKITADIVLPVTVTADKTAPTVTKTEVVDEDTIKIFFSEDMDSTLATDESKFTVKDSAAKKVTTGFSNTYSEDSTKSEYYVTMQFDAKLTGGAYTIEVKDQEDESLYANKLGTVTLNAEITDKTAMTYDAVTVTAVAGSSDSDKEIIYITFSEKVATTGQYSALNKDNYTFKAYAGATTYGAFHADTTLELFGTTGKVVKISMPHVASFDADNVTVQIGRIADAAGNVYNEFFASKTSNPEAGATVASAKQTDYNKLEIKFDKVLKSILPDAIRVTGTGISGTAVAAVDEWKVNDDNTTTVNVTIKGDTVTQLKTVKTDYTTVTSFVIDSFDLIGEYVVTETDTKSTTTTGLTVTDARVPTMINITSGGAVTATITTGIAIQMSEVMGTTMTSVYASDIVLKVVKSDGTEETKTAFTDYTVIKGSSAGLTDNYIVIVAADGLNGLAAGKYKVASKDSITYIVDVAGNKAAKFTDAKEVVLP